MAEMPSPCIRDQKAHPGVLDSETLFETWGFWNPVNHTGVLTLCKAVTGC